MQLHLLNKKCPWTLVGLMIWILFKHSWKYLSLSLFIACILLMPDSGPRGKRPQRHAVSKWHSPRFPLVRPSPLLWQILSVPKFRICGANTVNSTDSFPLFFIFLMPAFLFYKSASALLFPRDSCHNFWLLHDLPDPFIHPNKKSPRSFKGCGREKLELTDMRIFPLIIYSSKWVTACLFQPNLRSCAL